jgi:hypothetical protein
LWGSVLVNTSKKASFLNATFVIAGVAVFTSSVNAAIILEHGGKVTIGTAYHSNIQFVNDEDKESVYLYSIVPEYKLSALDDNDKWYGTVGVNLERSSNYRVARRRENPFANIGWEHTFEHSTVELEADYVKERTRNSQFGQTGVLAANGVSVTKSLSAAWKYALAAKWDLTATADYLKNKFSGVAALSDFTTTSAGAELMYKYSETIKPYASVVASEYRAKGVETSQINYQTYLAGSEIELGSKLTMNVNVGMALFNSSHSRDEAVGGVALTYTGNRHALTTSLDRSLNPTGLNDIQVTDVFSTKYSYALSERSTWGLGMGFTQNNLDLDTQALTAFYDFDLTPSWLMHLEAGTRNVKNAREESVDDTAVGIFFTYTSPRF